jgi:hypothetical protein
LPSTFPYCKAQLLSLPDTWASGQSVAALAGGAAPTVVVTVFWSVGAGTDTGGVAVLGSVALVAVTGVATAVGPVGEATEAGVVTAFGSAGVVTVTGVVAAPVLAEGGPPGDVLTACGASWCFLIPLTWVSASPLIQPVSGSILIPVLVWIVMLVSAAMPALAVATIIKPINTIVFISSTPHDISLEGSMRAPYTINNK